MKHICAVTALTVLLALAPFAIRSYELPLLISICSYNNEEWVVKNLDSIFSQKYANYHVIYIDDASTDATATTVENYLKDHPLKDKITFIRNTVRSRKLKNIYNLFHACPDDAIIIQVDGDDWLAHDHVFSIVNKAYLAGNIWFTYGQFMGRTGNDLMCKPVPEYVITNKGFRKWEWVYTHLRTFYAWLFKNIKLQDLLAEKVPNFSSKFYPVANDAATIFPMLEMANHHFTYIDQVLYVYNWTNPNLGIKVDHTLYGPATQEIKSKLHYPTLTRPNPNRLSCYRTATADAIIFSTENSKATECLITTLRSNLQALNAIHILCDAQQHYTAYEKLEKKYHDVTIYNASKQSVTSLLKHIFKKSTSQHVLFCSDSLTNVGHYDLNTCIYDLEKTFAHAFYLDYHHDKPPFTVNKQERIPHEHIYDHVYAWKFLCESAVEKKRGAQPNYYNTLHMTLINKDTAQQLLNTLHKKKGKISMHYTNQVRAFMDMWQECAQPDLHAIGLLV